ncbi:MAG: hypothetical protein LBE02_09305 [Spirochaetaceae bacterium]|jgi:hypothetical protein|nr:hypothetical protein [Spirochaetaceae bacterium]
MQRRIIFPARIGALVLFFLLLSWSCSQSAPEIRYGALELVYYENGGNPTERFTFFVLPQDNDGAEDLEELWLYHDWDGLSWRLSSGDWITQTVDGNLWIGSRAIAMEDDAPLPRGQFRAVLVDKGGSRSERLLSFDAPPERRREFPLLSISGDRYRIVSRYPEQNLLIYDDQGVYLLTVSPPALEGNISALGFPSQAESVSLWSRDPARSVSAFTDIVPLHD